MLEGTLNTWYAHSLEGLDESFWQSLTAHSNNVATIAGRFAADFGFEPWGKALGALHDGGKACPPFQSRLHGSSIRVDHSIVGALIAQERYKELGNILAYAIAGHHGGMPNATEHGTSHSLLERTILHTEPCDGFFDLLNSGEIELPEFNDLEKSLAHSRTYGCKESIRQCQAYSIFMLIRMLFSCLVDADYLDTEAFCSPEVAEIRKQQRASHSDLIELQNQLEQYMKTLHKKVTTSEALATGSQINRIRYSIHQDCIYSADSNPGLFTLTVPTGGGKTLSSLAFAIKHAVRNGQKRIIYAIPFTSIVEQTVSVLKEIFPENDILEHHSNFNFDDMDEEGRLKHRLAVQNWDVPIIVTTNVQLFESLYSNKPSKSRKIHNIANSVIILDEAQTLPDALLKPSLAALEELAFGYNTSVLLCTATQPALSNHWPFGSRPTEIVKNRDSFKSVFDKRVKYVILGETDEEDLVKRIASCRQALCIVGTRNEAANLYKKLTEEIQISAISVGSTRNHSSEIFHLSASMVPAHRTSVLKTIRERLEQNKPCIAISTQLIEAGVDIDFPVVFREMAGLDSIIQAGGRCNREGKQESGTVFVFDYLVDGQRQKTESWLEKMKLIGSNILKKHNRVDTAAIEDFFITRYRSHDIDSKCIYRELSDLSMITTKFQKYQFERYSNDFHLIDENGFSIFVPWGKEGRNLYSQLKTSDIPGALSNELQQYIVNVPAYRLNEYINQRFVVFFDPYYVLDIDNLHHELYRDDIGLVLPGEEVLKELII